MILEQMFWYNKNMENYSHPTLDFDRNMDHPLQLSPRQLHLVLAPHHAQRQMMTILTARLALTGRVRLVDAGNCFDGYGLARQLRQQTSYWQAGPRAGERGTRLHLLPGGDPAHRVGGRLLARAGA